MTTRPIILERRNTVVQRNRNVLTYKTATRRLGPVTSLLFLVIAVGILAMLYLTQVTKLSVYGYQVSSLDDEKEALVERRQELEIEAARLNSINRIKAEEVAKNLQPENQVGFAR